MYSFRSLTAIRRRITEHDVLVDGPACPVKAINHWCLGVKEDPGGQVLGFSAIN